MDEKLKISDPHNCQVIFVNQVVGQGYLNGVVNVTLGTARFTPDDEGKVDVDMIVASRLRMDIQCAVQLRDALDGILKQVLPKEGETVN